MDKTKCFALRKGECTALIYKVCDNCNFYKTVEQKEADEQRSIRRNNSLGIPSGKAYVESLKS